MHPTAFLLVDIVNLVPKIWLVIIVFLLSARDILVFRSDASRVILASCRLRPLNWLRLVLMVGTLILMNCPIWRVVLDGTL